MYIHTHTYTHMYIQCVYYICQNQMSFIAQVCLFVIVTEAPQCNRMTATGQDTDNKRAIYYIGNAQNGKNTIYNTDNYVWGLTCANLKWKISVWWINNCIIYIYIYIYIYIRHTSFDYWWKKSLKYCLVYFFPSVNPLTGRTIYGSRACGISVSQAKHTQPIETPQIDRYVKINRDFMIFEQLVAILYTLSC